MCAFPHTYSSNLVNCIVCMNLSKLSRHIVSEIRKENSGYEELEAVSLFCGDTEKPLDDDMDVITLKTYFWKKSVFPIEVFYSRLKYSS